jgi:DNA-binding CsgD family transcriptional regulator
LIALRKNRETEALKLMVSGISNREIAKALRIGDSTVSTI